jgi:uncharacterized DUF497 family protein
LQYSFEWDLRKAQENLRKHKISFDRASTIFLDPHALSIFDTEHSQNEDRWITLGIDSEGSLLVVIHTFSEISDSLCRIRIISARKAIKKEIKQYEE